jgi:DinB superfamily
MTAAVRARLLVAVDRPQIAGFDQDEFARRLHYDRPIEASLEAFKAARRVTAELLEKLSEADWTREGTHSEHGPYTLERWLEIYATHAHKHAEQILVAREAGRKQ